MILLVLLILSVGADSRAEMSTLEPELSSVPIPTNLTFKAYNLNPVLHWEYQQMPQTPVFTVQVKSYRKGKWIDVCTDITHHYCNIIQEVDDPTLSLWARVKAQVGEKESGYVESEEFVLCQKSKIGPPSLSIKKGNNKLTVDIYHPVVEINGEVWGTMYDSESTCYTFEYSVYVRMNRSETIHMKPVHEEDCNEILCQLSLTVPSLNTEYCISADGFSEEWAVTTEKSNEICITVLNSNDKVPIPTNLTFKAYNLNPVLHWEYQQMPQTPMFTVQVKSYRKGKWIDVCTDITHHYCNIIQEVDDPTLSLWARVKAQVGEKESGYVESEEFVLCQKSKIGPPSLSIKKGNNKLTVDIYHPVVEINGEVWGTMYDSESTCYTFEYSVYVRMNRSETIHMKPVHEEDCNEILCQLSLTVPSLNTEYCISADGFSEEWAVTTEKSNEICITVLNSNDKDAVWIPIVATFALFLISILVFSCWYIKKDSCKRKSIILPKSLLSVVRNGTSETIPELKYVSLITSCQPFVPDSDTTTLCVQETLSPETTPCQPKQAEQRELSSETQVFTAEKNASDTVPGSPSAPVKREDSVPSSSSQSGPLSVTLNSYHSRSGSDSGLVGSDSTGSDPDFPPHPTPERKTEQESTALRIAPSSFGYDKPHVLVEVAVGDGDGGQESLIGYRLAAEAKDRP